MSVLFKNLWTSLRRYPTAVSLNVAGLAVAFTAFLVILMQVRFERSFDEWIPNAECVYRVELAYAEEGPFQTCLSQPLINDLTAASPHIVAGSLCETGRHLDMELKAERSNGKQDFFHEHAMRCTPELLDVLGIRMVEGDVEGLRETRGVVLPRSTARRIFGDESAVGQSLRLHGKMATAMGNPGEDTSFAVSGVYEDIPGNSVFDNAILWGHPWYNSYKGNCNYMCFIRIDHPDALPEVEEALKAKTREFYTGWFGKESPATVRLTAVRDIYYQNDAQHEMLPRKGNRTTASVLLAIALLVIGIASINYVNFASAMAPVRMKMVNLQKILGAGVGELRATLLVESTAIASASYLLALVLTEVLADTPLADYVDADMSLGANLPLIGQCALLALAVGAVAGIYPALYMTSFRPILAVKGSFGTSASGRRYRMALVGVQYVISVALIVATLFVNLQNRYLQRVTTGYDRHQVAVATLTPGLYAQRDALISDLKSFAGIEEVAFAYQKFGGEENLMGWGRGYKDFEGGIEYKVLLATPEILRVLGIRPAEGRGFSPADRLREPCSYVFNQTARRMWDMEPGDYVSQNDLQSDGTHIAGWGEVVGFLPDDFRAYSCHRVEEPFAFCVFGTINWGDGLAMPYCYVRIAAGTDLQAAVGHIRKAIDRLSPTPCDIELLDTVVDSLYRKDRKIGVLVTLFSVLAIAVSLMGVFGLVLFETQYRRKEIGIRKVNGASSASILAMFNRRFAAIVAGGFVVGAPLAGWGVSRWFEGFVSSIGLHAWVFVAALAVVAGITAATVTVRSWRTANENPIRSVKTE